MNFFSQAQGRKIKKNKFNLSHDKKLSFKIGNLVPVLLQEILPGDRFRVNSEVMIRLAPMIAPVMHRMDAYLHYFFVPNRILWSEWEDFITGGADGTSAPIAPFMTINNGNQTQFATKSLGDYLGLPSLDTTMTQTIDINALPFRAYAEIFNEYYRDQTLTPKVAYSKTGGATSGAEIAALSVIRNRAWEKDYFTSALPWAQRGPEVSIPGQVVDKMRYQTGAAPGVDGAVEYEGVTGTLEEAGGQPIELFADSPATINDLRKSVRLQEWLERNARGGARYIEQLLSHFGKAPKDARLQRPEYLGGGKQNVVISEVLNTAGSDTVDLEPVGQMAGHGISVGSSNEFTREFEEHGFVMAILSVIPRTAYMQGVHKLWQRFDKLEYAWPEFAQLGEQEIKQLELFYDGTTANTGTFGYTPRYSEYKYGCSTVHGEFRTSLDFWHMARKFATTPALNNNFVEVLPDDPELKRIFAVTDPDTDDLYCQVFHNISALRPLPYFGTPQL